MNMGKHKVMWNSFAESNSIKIGNRIRVYGWGKLFKQTIG